MGRNLRYALGAELHYIHENEDRPATVNTVQRWDCTNSATPRAISVTLVNGAELSRAYYVGQQDVDRLTDRIATLTGRVTELSDDQARAKVKEATGIEYPAWCIRAECGAPMPLGADRCAAGDSVGQVGGGSISGLRWVGTIKAGGQK